MFQLFKQNGYLVAGLILAIALTSCNQTETITIDADPVSNPNTDKTPVDTSASPASADFMQLNMGELHPIHSLDPLFAQNTSTMRALQLVYEGLVRFNKDGNIRPAVANKWAVSSDSLTYTFTLHNDVYYQDSDIFPNGIGRKLTSGDVRFAFERMAKITVPPNAARLFMNIRGFEPYFQEQHNVYNPDERKLPTIRGIATPNDSTVLVTLEKADPYFLQKLASPYALIYPREAVANKAGGAITPVGTGPFEFTKKESETRFIFSKFKNFHGDDAKLSRIDVITGMDETDLFQSFVKGDIHFIPEMGPQMLKGILINKTEFSPGYEGQYNLHQNNAWLHYSLQYNPSSDYPMESAVALAQLADSTFRISESGSFTKIEVLRSDSSYTALSDTTTLVFTDDPFTSWFTGLLNRKIVGDNTLLQMRNIKTPTRNTGIFYRQYFSFTASRYMIADENALIEISVYPAGLSHKNLAGIRMNSYPWWIDLRETTISDSDN